MFQATEKTGGSSEALPALKLLDFMTAYLTFPELHVKPSIVFFLELSDSSGCLLNRAGAIRPP